MKSPRYFELNKLLVEALRVLHEYSHPAIVAINQDLNKELFLCQRRELFLNRYKAGIIAAQPIKFK